MTMRATELQTLIEEVWATVAGTPLSPAPLASGGGAELAAAIAFRGSHPATLVVACDGSLATALAAAFFGGDAVPTAADARSAVHELVNMIAGHVAGAIGGDCRIGLPADATAPLAPAAAGGELVEAAWTAGPGRLHVRLVPVVVPSVVSPS